MKFHLVPCLYHGLLICNANALPKKEKADVECTGGHRFITDTRSLPLYEGDEIHLPDNALMTKEQLAELLESRKIKLISGV